ncbi:MAG: FeoB-associated Cys-rich membrane protein [Verrucomicrobia bacterium]|nr:FeoB-associated Cys-rich membrane protein [Verrucomicrobiota bacterium]
MSASLQTTIALILVVLTVVAFFYRWLRDRKKSGCGGGCGCSFNKIKFQMEEKRLTNIAFTYANTVLCDGAGSQLHRLYGVYALSRRFNVSYYHSPLKEIGYQGVVALEKNENSAELLKRYNDIFNIPSDIELPKKFEIISLEIGDGEALAKLVQHAREKKNKFFLVALVCTAPFSDRNPTVFECVKPLSPFKKKSSPIFRVAIHVRWGDLPIGHAERLLPNDYYIKAATKVIELLEKAKIPFVCELHTELPTKPFLVTADHHGMKNRIDRYRPEEPVMLTPEQYGISDFDAIPNLQQRINEDPIETLEALATADLLMMSKSSFSYLAALFNQEGSVLYAPFWHPPMADWIKWNPPILFTEAFEEYCEKWKKMAAKNTKSYEKE